ncbi:MAG: hypothetical protein N3G21_01600 [Candidatus Hydrogenedentes bacterium]|nr:hypothetical protein [Candidatus Hydrogenedentota bacterium]
MKKHIYLISFSVPILLFYSSCATLKEYVPWSNGKSEQGQKQEKSSLQVKVPTKEDYISELRNIIENEIKTASTADKNRIYRKRPYYWKNYAVYDEQTPNIEIQETDSKAKPYIARVKLNKTLYYTRLHRNRRDAEEDENLIRGIGTETSIYELRNGRWVKIGSTFIPEKTEKYEGNQWVAVREEEVVKEQSLEKPKEGFFKRIRSWIF